jgi:GrpB-like predicted nucleotidyltransferase (UPF0157 family)
MSDAVPPWAYENAEAHAHDPRWAGRAGIERARLIELLAPWLVDGVEHVGSTAVAGLAANRSSTLWRRWRSDLRPIRV